MSVHVLSSTTALMSWTSSQENYNSTIVSVVSLTCQKQKESQRLEKQYCTQVKELEGQTGSLTSCSPASRGMQGGRQWQEAVLRSPRCVPGSVTKSGGGARKSMREALQSQSPSFSLLELPSSFYLIPHSREYTAHLRCAGYWDRWWGSRQFLHVLLWLSL